MADLRKCNDKERGLFAHDERNLNNPVRFRKNHEIDKARTHQNYDLISGATAETARRGDLEKRLEARLAELTIRKRRANTVTFGSWVVTLPAELKKAPQEQQREFFKHTVEFMQNRYGAANVIGAWVHNDETTPHVHVKFVPEERKKTLNAEGEDVTDYNAHEGTGVLLGKDIFKRGEYQTFHRDLQRHLEKRMGMRLSILNGNTLARGGSASVDQLKGEAKQAEMLARDTAEAAAAAGRKMAEAAKQAEALVEHYGAAVADAKRHAESGGFWKSGWQKRLEALEQGQADLVEQRELIMAAAKFLQDAPRLVPEWAQSGIALAAAAADMSARARKQAEKDKRYWGEWQQKWQKRLQTREQQLKQREKRLDELIETRADERLQARRDEITELDERRMAAESGAQLAENRRQRAEEECATTEVQLSQVAGKLKDTQSLLLQAQETLKQCQDEAEQLRQANTPAGLLRDALAASCEAYGDDLTIQGINAQLSGGDAQQHISDALWQQQLEQQRSMGLKLQP